MDDGAAHILEIGALEDEVRHYVKRQDDETLFLLTKGRVDTIVKNAEELIETEGDIPVESSLE
jgi:hypothetical protein